jgi:hypothetical protein
MTTHSGLVVSTHNPAQGRLPFSKQNIEQTKNPRICTGLGTFPRLFLLILREFRKNKSEAVCGSILITPVHISSTGVKVVKPHIIRPYSITFI